MALTPGRGRRLLPAQKRMLLEDAAARVPTLADGLLPFPALATRRTAEAVARSSAQGATRGGRARPGAQRGRDRQPGGEDHPGWRARAGLRRRKAHRRAQAPPPSGYQRVGVGRTGPRRRPSRPGRRAAVAGREAEATAAGVGVGGRCVHGRVSQVGARQAWLAGGEVPYHRDRQLWRYGLWRKPRGFLILPRRWVVERTFAWLGLSRRFSKDYERLPETAEAMIYWAMSRLMLRRRLTRRVA